MRTVPVFRRRALSIVLLVLLVFAGVGCEPEVTEAKLAEDNNSATLHLERYKRKYVVPVDVTVRYDTFEEQELVMAGELFVAWHSPSPSKSERLSLLRKIFQPHAIVDEYREDCNASNILVIVDGVTPQELGQLAVDALPDIRKLNQVEYALPCRIVTLY